MSKVPFIVITPARNEEQYLAQTIESVVSQTLLPSIWVIVDDGSTDATASIAERAARKHPWIKVVGRENRGHRSLGSGVVEALYSGLGTLAGEDYDFLFKIDADIALGPHFFEAMLAKFAENPGLGIASGDAYELVETKVVHIRVLPLAFTGAVKCWRRKCFEEIGGLISGPGWDALDAYQAMRLGWQTATFEEPALRATHLRPEGSSVKNKYWFWLRRGKGLHFAGAHPLWVLASAMYHMLDRPFVLGGMSMLIGYLTAVIDKSATFGDAEFRTYLRRWQLKRLARILRLA
jgi:glycosyltransferase involved in cell wall biosynthesis